jgi:hypothetical protein
LPLRGGVTHLFTKDRALDVGRTAHRQGLQIPEPRAFA